MQLQSQFAAIASLYDSFLPKGGKPKIRSKVKTPSPRRLHFAPSSPFSIPQSPQTLEKSLARSSVRPPWAPLWRSPSPRPRLLRTPRAPWWPPHRWRLRPRSPPRRRCRRRRSRRPRRRGPWFLLPQPMTRSSSQVGAVTPAFGHQYHYHPSNFEFGWRWRNDFVRSLFSTVASAVEVLLHATSVARHEDVQLAVERFVLDLARLCSESTLAIVLRLGDVACSENV